MSRLQALLLDVEGVLVADKRYQAVPGALRRVRAMRTARIPMRLITNNTTDDRPTIIAKLTAADYDFTIDELHTCTHAATQHLQRIGARRALVLGTDKLREIVRVAGVAVEHSAAVDAVVVGLDRSFDYAGLSRACAAIVQHGAQLVALHRNRVFTDENGAVVPSVGALVAAIEHATGATAAVMGKPSEAYYQQVLDDVGVAPEAAALVSDDPFSDLAGANALGIATAFVLSGKYADPAIAEQLPAESRPQVVAADLDAVFSESDWNTRFGA